MDQASVGQGVFLPGAVRLGVFLPTGIWFGAHALKTGAVSGYQASKYFSQSRGNLQAGGPGTGAVKTLAQRNNLCP